MVSSKDALIGVFELMFGSEYNKVPNRDMFAKDNNLNNSIMEHEVTN